MKLLQSFMVIPILMLCLAGCQDDVPDAELVGTLWTLQSIEVPGEPDILPEATKVYNIQFIADYRVEGQDDCNTYFGIYTLSDESEIRLDSLLTTLKGCGPSRIGHQYYQALRVVDAYEIRGNTLKLHFDLGSVLQLRFME